jgi:hypothetical protein
MYMADKSVSHCDACTWASARFTGMNVGVFEEAQSLMLQIHCGVEKVL